MKHSVISILVAGLFAGTATATLAADDVKTDNKPADTPTSRAADPNTKDQMGSKEMPPVHNQAKHDKGAAAFKKADKDSDGTLDKMEAKSISRVSKNFDAIDADHDGTVSMDEVHTYMAAHSKKKGDM